MKILTKPEEFANATSESLVLCECYNCGEPFSTKKKYVNSEQKNALGKVKYCGMTCYRLGKVRRSIISCKQCGANVLKRNIELKRGAGAFCNSSCSARYNNMNKTHGTRVSKFEIFCQEQLLLDFPGLFFVFNGKEAIGSELDIFIPQLKLAFELNGILHYEPIYGLGKFNQIQSNDKGKVIRCYEKGIELAIVDTSTLKYNVAKRFAPYYERIKELIQLNISRLHIDKS